MTATETATCTFCFRPQTVGDRCERHEHARSRAEQKASFRSTHAGVGADVLRRGRAQEVAQRALEQRCREIADPTRGLASEGESLLSKLESLNDMLRLAPQGWQRDIIGDYRGAVADMVREGRR